MTFELSTGFFDAVENATSRDDLPEKFQAPILQILRPMSELPGKNRFKVTLFDGDKPGMVFGDLDTLPQDRPGKFDIVKLSNFELVMAKQRGVVYVHNMDFLSHADEALGLNTAEEDGDIPASVAASVPAATTNPTPAKRMASTNEVPPGVQAQGFPATVMPIERLSPYQNKWAIKARVTAKADKKKFTNAKGEGQLFNVTFIDETGEIRATGFNQEVDKFYPMLEEGQVYYVTQCRVTMANKKFSNVNNDYELMFGRDTVIIQADDAEAAAIPTANYSFVTLDKLQEVDVGNNVDVLGVVQNVGPLEDGVAKATGNPYKRRNLMLGDKSGFATRLTFFGEKATSFDEATVPVGTIIAIKGARVGDFNGRNLSTSHSSTIAVEPAIDETYALKGWYASEGKQTSFKQLQTTPTNKTVAATPIDVVTASYGQSEKPDYYTLQAWVVHIRTNNFAYPACQTPDCNKKVIESGEEWLCEKCNKTMDKPLYRYILSINVGDATGSMWLTAFNEPAEVIVGLTADQLTEIQTSQGDDEYEQAVQQVTGKQYTLRCRSKQEFYNEESKARHQVLTAQALDYPKDIDELIKDLDQYM
ncbi:Replication factor A protein 1 [Yarrowia sp. C11]|nr:Replication factor A protein 1 [Yarrowia sp. C11]KAG5370456.1 Replication factor A protein 1 [Yarrowia sp. E02]